jgi:chlorophyll synthase
MAGGAIPHADSLLLALLYSIAAHGIMTLNDFKSVTGDRQMGVASLPVQLGVYRAARVACWVMIVPQVIVIVMLISWGQSWHALGVLALLLGQINLMRYFVVAPIERALMFSGFGVPQLVAGMMIAAFALRTTGAAV